MVKNLAVHEGQMISWNHGNLLQVNPATGDDKKGENMAASKHELIKL